jgi:RNA polymerase sigma-70 factor (ECF subfamily)
METVQQVGAVDEDLVDAARGGDREAFSRLVARDRGLVYGYAYARLCDREEAEDIAQETFARAYLSLARLRGAGAWRGWLLRIAGNLCTDALRRQRRRRTEPLDPLWPDGAPSPETQVLAAERQRELRAAVRALPDKYRVPMLLRFASGFTRREIALALSLPQSTITGRLAQAARLIRRELGEE